MKEFPTQQKQMADHVKKNLAKGYTPDTLRYALLAQGYSRTSVDSAIKAANQELSPAITKSKEKPKITYKVVDDNEMKQIQEKARIDLEATPNIFQRLLRRVFD